MSLMQQKKPGTVLQPAQKPALKPQPLPVGGAQPQGTLPQGANQGSAALANFGKQVQQGPSNFSGTGAAFGSAAKNILGGGRDAALSGLDTGVLWKGPGLSGPGPVMAPRPGGQVQDRAFRAQDAGSGNFMRGPKPAVQTAAPTTALPGAPDPGDTKAILPTTPVPGLHGTIDPRNFDNPVTTAIPGSGYQGNGKMPSAQTPVPGLTRRVDPNSFALDNSKQMATSPTATQYQAPVMSAYDPTNPSGIPTQGTMQSSSIGQFINDQRNMAQQDWDELVGASTTDTGQAPGQDGSQGQASGGSSGDWRQDLMNLFLPQDSRDGTPVRSGLPDIGGDPGPGPPGGLPGYQDIYNWAKGQATNAATDVAGMVVDPAAAAAERINQRNKKTLDGWFDTNNDGKADYGLDENKAYAKGLLDPANQKAADDAAQQQLVNNVNSQTDRNLRMQMSRAAGGGRMGGGSTQAAFDSANKQIGEGTLQNVKDAFQRKMQSGQLGTQINSDAARQINAILNDQYTSPNDIMAIMAQVAPEVFGDVTQLIGQLAQSGKSPIMG